MTPPPDRPTRLTDPAHGAPIVSGATCEWTAPPLPRFNRIAGPFTSTASTRPAPVHCSVYTLANLCEEPLLITLCDSCADSAPEGTLARGDHGPLPIRWAAGPCEICADLISDPYLDWVDAHTADLAVHPDSHVAITLSGGIVFATQDDDKFAAWLADRGDEETARTFVMHTGIGDDVAGGGA